MLVCKVRDHYLLCPYYKSFPSSPVSHLPKGNPNNCFRASCSSLHEFKWQINGRFHTRTVKAVRWYGAMHVASSSTHLGASFSRSHLLQKTPALLSNKICPRTDGTNILPSRIVTVRSVLPCGALRPNRRIGTQLSSRIQGTPE